MRRSAWAVVLIGLIGGCASTGGIDHGGGPPVQYGKKGPPTVPGVAGPYGEKIPMAAPYAYSPPMNAYAAQRMMSHSVPLNMVQMHSPGMGAMGGPGGMMPPPMMPPGGMLSPPGLPFAPGASPPGGGPMPPGAGINPASFKPGMPSGQVINAHIAPGQMPPGGVVPVQAMAPGGADLMRFPTTRTQVKFTKPAGMKVYWYTRGADGKEAYSSTPIETPGRYNFAPGVYRLKLANIPGRPGVDLYPTLEVVPCNPKTEAFLAHNAVPVNFTDHDFRQVAEGNYLVKVIYLPDPQYQDVAGTGIDEILNNPLEPGMDPIQEALRRGSILLVIRMGNVDQEAPNTPPLVSVPPAGALPPGMVAPGAMPPGMMPPGMVPPGMMPPGMPGGMMPPGMFPDPRTGPLFQVPMYGRPPGAMVPPPSLSGVPLPGGTPLPPGVGGSTAKPPTGLIPPPDVAPGISAPPALPGGPFGIPGASLLEGTKDKTGLATPGAPGGLPSGAKDAAVTVPPLPGKTEPVTTPLPATPIVPPPIPKVDATVPPLPGPTGAPVTAPPITGSTPPGVPPLPPLPTPPTAPTPPPVIPVPTTVPPTSPPPPLPALPGGSSLEPALPGPGAGTSSLTPTSRPTVADLAGKR